MSGNRSTEELAMRDAVAKWGRSKWPCARVVHELVIAEKRIDMAFIGTDHIAGVEIKGPKDRLDRLGDQWGCFTAHIPEVWLAIAPKWIDPLRKNHFAGAWSYGNKIVVDLDTEHPVRAMWGERGAVDRTITAPLLRLLWRSEALAVAVRYRDRVSVSPRTPLRSIVPELARKLTGDEIVRQVCHELRGRDAFPASPASDPPIRGESMADRHPAGCESEGEPEP